MSTDAPKKDSINSDSSMSDDEARRILAEMDEPLIPDELGAPEPPTTPQDLQQKTENDAVSQTQNSGKNPDPAATLEPPVPDHDHDHEQIPSPSDTHQPHLKDADSLPQGGDDLEEVAEFATNEFAADPDMLADFKQNSTELMEALDQNILALEQNPTDKETIESIFRAAHTLKGAAGMFGFSAIERVMHRMENLFDQVRKGKLVPSPDTIDLVFRGLDTIRVLITAAVTQTPSGIKTAQLVKNLDLALSDTPRTIPVAAPLPETKAPDASPQKMDQSTIRVDLDRLDMLVNLVGELVIDRTRFSTIDTEIRTLAPHLKAATHLSEAVQTFGRHMAEIHEIVMKIRMVPIGNTFNKFTRVVRDLARQLGKDIHIEIKGEETELDKTLVEQIGDPLIHLIRNACDHGIETPSERTKAGKNPTGRIEISAKQEGHYVTITIRDDGKGIPLEAVRRKGIERGLIKESDTLSTRDIFNLIFEPGFSTAEKVTNVSGRGVGMDVVRKQIGKLKGIIEIDSERGKGTQISIRLPLTLAIVQSLLVKSSESTFALPLSSVIESVRIRSDEIQRVGQAEVIKRHDRVLPLLHLPDVLDLKTKEYTQWYRNPKQNKEIGDLIAFSPSSKRTSTIRSRLSATQTSQETIEKLFVVIVGAGEKRFGIVVDQLLHQQEMVIKSLGTILSDVPCIAGGSVLGNGEVALVLDVPELEERFRLRHLA